MRRRQRRTLYYNPTFKQLFPNWEVFSKYLKDYSVYYDSEEYTDARAIVYFTILYRQFANSNVAYDYEIFLEKLSLTISENFREFFKIKDMLDYVENLDVLDLVKGVETISNVAANPNINTDKDTILNYIGTQSRTRSTENIVDRVYNNIRRIKVNEIMNEIVRYEYLFVQIPPSPIYLYNDDREDLDVSYRSVDDDEVS